MRLEGLSELQLDALREVGSIGAGHAATALSQLVGMPVGVRNPEIDIIPFESARQYSGSVNRAGEALRVHVKGAPERILPMCGGGVEQDAALAEVERLAAEGFRVIAVAAGDLDEWVGADDTAAVSSLEFLGLCGLIDPLRSEVACKTSGSTNSSRIDSNTSP